MKHRKDWHGTAGAWLVALVAAGMLSGCAQHQPQAAYGVQSGGPPVAYQWRFNATNVANMSNPPTTTVIQSGQAPLTYQWYKTGTNVVVTTNASGTIATVPAGEPPLYYQWHFHRSNVVDASNLPATNR